MAERQVDDADVVARAVGDDPFDAGDDIARVAAAVGAEHPDVDEIRAGAMPPAYSGATPLAGAGLPAMTTGDVRTVTVRIGHRESR